METWELSDQQLVDGFAIMRDLHFAGFDDVESGAHLALIDDHLSLGARLVPQRRRHLVLRDV